MHRHFDYDEWLAIHEKAAPDYRAGEWVREVACGVGNMRRDLFARAEGRVLDVGCGYGMNFAYLPGATHVTGIDFSPTMLAMARGHAARLGIQADLRRGDAERLDFEDGSFDTVISALSTCSFFNPVEALREMKRVVRPGGRVLLVEHGRSDWPWLGRYMDRQTVSQIENGGCRWNQEPQDLVDEAGLRIVEARRRFAGVFHSIEAALD
jgi:ubiquinone/menaquinone biosynthesis C-methylase UbiE